ncbi:hypothetical protein KC19_4G207100 [Ceratodon purpureus]|uniref:Uncharacterized protein n=1 Tax=Ceratodon purpureus TaxID=3225 RepID=A0A8T0ID94_CERPU|nr:hypothetical protein KC19_4G207100 [Ceratodon purpureus]
MVHGLCVDPNAVAWTRSEPAIYSLAQVPAAQSQSAPHFPPFSLASVPAAQSQSPHLPPFSLAQVPAAQSQLAPHFPVSLAIFLLWCKSLIKLYIIASMEKLLTKHDINPSIEPAVELGTSHG